MRVINLREFRKNLSKILNNREKVIIAKRNKPIYILQPLDPADEFLLWLDEASKEIEQLGLTPNEIEQMFEEARNAADRKLRDSGR